MPHQKEQEKMQQEVHTFHLLGSQSSLSTTYFLKSQTKNCHRIWTYLHLRIRIDQELPQELLNQFLWWFFTPSRIVQPIFYNGFSHTHELLDQFLNFQYSLVWFLKTETKNISSNRLPKHKIFFNFSTFLFDLQPNLANYSCGWLPMWIHHKIGGKNPCLEYIQKTITYDSIIKSYRKFKNVACELI